MKEMLFNKNRKIILVAAAMIVVGGIAWASMLLFGLYDTANVGNAMSWGLLIAVFAFLVGFGAGSQFIASLIVLFKQDHLLPWATLAQVIALAGGCGAGVAIIADLGSPWNMLAMILTPNPASPLTWDMIALTAFVVVSLSCLIALVRNWKSTRMWMAIGLIVAVALQIVEGALFALQNARLWWHSPVVVVDFIAVAFVCGLSLMMLLVALSRKDETQKALRLFARWLCFALVLHLVFALIELGILVSETTPAAVAVKNILIQYLPLYLMELVLPLCAAVVLWVKRKDLSSKVCVGCSVAVILGMFAHRMMLLYPALAGSTLFVSLSNTSSPFWAYPVSTGLFGNQATAFALVQLYAPSFVEWVSALMPIGLVLLISAIGMNVVYSLQKK